MRIAVVLVLTLTCFAQTSSAQDGPTTTLSPPELPLEIQRATDAAKKKAVDVPRKPASKTTGSFDSMLKDFEKRVSKSEKLYEDYTKKQDKKWDELEETLEKKEKDWEKLEEKWEKQDERWDEQNDENTEFSKALKKAVVSGTSNTRTMKIVGRVHADYWGFPSTDGGVNVIETGDRDISVQDRIEFRRLRFGVRGDVNDLMEYRIEMEFGGGNDVEFRDAWLGFKQLGWLGKVLIGNQKRPYGLDHLNSSRHNVFAERPFIVESFNQDARRFGIQSYNTSEDLAWNWRYGVFNQRLIQGTGLYNSDHLQGELAGRLANTAWYDETSGGRGYAHWAVSGTIAFPDASGGPFEENEARFRQRPEARTVERWLDTGRIAGADQYELLNFEGVLNFGSFNITGEYQNLFLQRESGFEDVFLHGGYVQASYFLTGEHLPWNRKSGTIDRVKPFENFFLLKGCEGCTVKGKGAWQVAARYSFADFNNEDVSGGVAESVTLGINWYWNANARMQFNYIFGSIDDRGLDDGTFTSGDYQIIGTRVMIDF